MIIRVEDEKRADICDELLTKLIQDERQYDSSIDVNLKVKDYFKNIIKYNGFNDVLFFELYIIILVLLVRDFQTRNCNLH